MFLPQSGILGFTKGISPVPLPNQVTSRTAFVPFTDAVNNDWQGRYYAIETAAGYWMAVWVEGTNHSDYNSASHYVNIHFSDDEGATWSDNNEYIGGAAITGFPLVPPGGSSTGFVDFTIIRCPNDDLVIIAQDRGSNPSVWNGVNFSQHQYRSTDNGQTWTYEYDFCEEIGLTTTADKAKIQGLFENMVLGNDVYITLCQIRTDLNDTRISLYKSSDNCATWSLVSHPLAYDELDPDATASAIAHLGNGKFICIFRTQDLGTGYKKISNDFGLTWEGLTEFSSVLGYVGIHDPKVKSYSNFFLLYGRDNKKIINNPAAALFERNSWWTTNDLFENSAQRHYLDPFYAGTGAANQGDAGYTRALQKADGSFMFFGYYGTNFTALIYKYDVSNTAAPSDEEYSNTDFFPETITDQGVRLQLNRDNVEVTSGTPSVGEAVILRAHNTLALSPIVWAAAGTVTPEFIVLNSKGWVYFNNGRVHSNETTLGQDLFNDSFTVCLWMKPDDGQPAASERIFQCVKTNAITSPNDQAFIQLTTGGTLLCRYGEDTSGITSSFITGAAVFPNGTTAATHVAWVVTSGVGQEVYIDGVSVASDGVNTGSMAGITMSNFTNATPIVLGCRNNAGSFDLPYHGLIREFIIMKGALSAGQIASIMSN